MSDPGEQIVRTMLYEGYMLYPYRPSALKNQHRWLFGTIYPAGWVRRQAAGDASAISCSCLIETATTPRLDVEALFFQVVQRDVLKVPGSQCAEPVHDLDRRKWESVALLEAGGQRYRPWQEADEQRVRLSGLLDCGRVFEQRINLPASEASRPVFHEGRLAGHIVRRCRPVEGRLRVDARPIEPGLTRVDLELRNDTLMDAELTRGEAALSALVSCHLLLRIEGGQFVSLHDPPPRWAEHAANCRHDGLWPVLVGRPGRRDRMLCAPVVLYDYAQVAPESPAPFFDGTEIDELLALRVQTLTDDEKAEVSLADERTRQLLHVAEQVQDAHLLSLHGATRQPTVAMEDEECEIDHALRPGDRVRLRPQAGADALDLLLDGMTATVEKVERDYEDRVMIAVTLVDDPGQDLGRLGKPGHRFYFRPEELEPMASMGGVHG